MAKEEGGLSSLFDFLAKIGALVVLVAMGFETILALLSYFGVQFNAETLGQIVYYQQLVLEWAALALAGLVALELAFKRGFILFIIVAVLLAIVIIPKFFPDLWLQIDGAIQNVAK